MAIQAWKEDGLSIDQLRVRDLIEQEIDQLLLQKKQMNGDTALYQQKLNCASEYPHILIIYSLRRRFKNAGWNHLHFEIVGRNVCFTIST